MKNCTNKTLLFVIISCLGSQIGFTQKASLPKIQYVCSPCGINCDTKMFEAPSKCPTCKMKLVDKKFHIDN